MTFAGAVNCSDPKDALFHHDLTGCLAFFNDSFRPLFTTDDIFGGDVNLRNTAVRTCGNNTACLFDVARTKDPAFGQATKESQESVEKTSEEESTLRAEGEGVCYVSLPCDYAREYLLNKQLDQRFLILQRLSAVLYLLAKIL